VPIDLSRRVAQAASGRLGGAGAGNPAAAGSPCALPPCRLVRPDAGPTPVDPPKRPATAGRIRRSGTVKRSDWVVVAGGGGLTKTALKFDGWNRRGLACTSMLHLRRQQSVSTGSAATVVTPLGRPGRGDELYDEPAMASRSADGGNGSSRPS
jgi:hypothetical protein